MKECKAANCHAAGGNCCQSVLVDLSDLCGLDEETALRLGCGFSGGARVKELCGALAGAVMAIGLAKGNTDVTDLETRDGCYRLVQELMDGFKAEFGAYACRDLLKSQGEVSHEQQRANCRASYVQWAAQKARTLLEK